VLTSLEDAMVDLVAAALTYCEATDAKNAIGMAYATEKLMAARAKYREATAPVLAAAVIERAAAR
jgi:hypothetical protein